VLGMTASAALDLPTGATVVCAFGLTLCVFGLGFRMGWVRAPRGEGRGALSAREGTAGETPAENR
jgi:hypothetical protein